MRLPRVRERTGRGRASIYAGVKSGTFPAPIKLGARAVGWLESEIDQWISARTAASRPNGNGPAK